MCYVWTFVERVKEQEKLMPLEKYIIDNEGYYRNTVAARLVNYALTGWLFCTSCFGMVVGSLWALGYIDIMMLPTW